MRAHGVELVVYLPPYHPAAWALIHADAHAAFALAALAARMAARLRDASDPESIPCGAEQFYDGVHVRVACLHAVIERRLVAPRPGGGPYATTPSQRFLATVEHEVKGGPASTE
jgi:hypothetical protein